MKLPIVINEKKAGSKSYVDLCFWKNRRAIRRLKRAQFAKQRIEIFKPAIDVRYDKEKVISHDLNEINSTPVTSSSRF